MELWKAIVMGILQGIAEFLPISSSGHLAIFKHILNIDLEGGGMLFDIMLHLGTLAAVFLCFWRDIKKLIIEGFGIIGDFFANLYKRICNLWLEEKKAYKKVIDSAYRKFVMLVIVSTIPTGIIGVVCKDLIERAGTTVLVPGICLVITGILLLIADWAKPGLKRPNQITYKEAVLVGTAQGIATMPGISRSGTTITTCLLCGFDKNFAVKYSFIMSIPAILGASILELKDFAKLKFTQTDVINYGIGMLAAAVIGYICIKTMLVIVRGKKYKWFSYYCFLVGTIAIVWYFVK